MRRPTGFAVPLGLIALVALAVRVAYAIAVRDNGVIGDALTFHLVGQALADGNGFVSPFLGEPTAEHPPLYEVFLAGLDLLGANGYLAHRLAGAVVGTGTVVLVGLLGRSVAGSSLGLAAAGIAAVYPMLFTADGALMSETLYGVFVVATLWAALAAARDPRPSRVAVVGVLVGLATLTRGEGLVLAVLLLVSLGWRRPRALVAGLGAFALALAPWTIRNLATFDEPVLLSTNVGSVLVGSNCEETYFGDLVGSWRFQCFTDRRPGEDESQFFARQREVGLAYARHHPDRLPVVVAARLGRLLEVYRPDQSAFINGVEGRPARPIKVAIRVFWGLALVAVAGAVLLARSGRRRELLVLLAPVVTVLSVAAATYGSTRFRFAAEPSLCVLAGFAAVCGVQRLRRTLPAHRSAPAAGRPG